MLREDHVCFDCKFNACDELCMFVNETGAMSTLGLFDGTSILTSGPKCDKNCKHVGECLYWNPRRPRMKDEREM